MAGYSQINPIVSDNMFQGNRKITNNFSFPNSTSKACQWFLKFTFTVYIVYSNNVSTVYYVYCEFSKKETENILQGKAVRRRWFAFIGSMLSVTIQKFLN